MDLAALYATGLTKSVSLTKETCGQLRNRKQWQVFILVGFRAMGQNLKGMMRHI